jgi:imidazolonepropionase-like amidohydrolase
MIKVFKGCTVIDGTYRSPLKDAIVVVEGNKIVKVATEGDMTNSPVGAAAEVYECSGKFLLPGLVNVHEHLAFKRAGFRLRELLYTSDNLYSVHAVKSSLLSLRNGVTTIREMGARNGINISVKQAIEAKLIPGPRMVVCGTPLAMSGAHSRRISWQVDGPGEVLKAAREVLRAGADFIKIFSSSDPVDVGADELALVEFGVEEMQAAIEEAHGRAKKVGVHSVGAKAIKNALDAGADSIEHGIYLNEPLTEQMIKQRTFLVPTISGYYEMGNPRWGWPKEFYELYVRLREPHLQSLALAAKMGVKIAVGTDSNGDMVDEMEFMVKGGLSPIEAIVDATQNGATLLGMEKMIGSLEPGKLADFILVDGDPLSNINSLRNLSLVVKDGSVFSKSQLEIIKEDGDV